MPNMEPKKNPMPVQDAYARICNFDEVALGYTYETAVEEAKRCLNCKHKNCLYDILSQKRRNICQPVPFTACLIKSVKN